MKMLAAITILALWAATPAIARDIEQMRRVFETRAAKVTVEAGGECSSALGEKCDQAGSAVILGLQGNTALLATAAHVLEQLYADGAPSLSKLKLTWPNPRASCTATLTPLAIWRQGAIENAAADIAFIAARAECGAPLEPVPNAWQYGEPSLGVTLHYMELYSPFGPHHLSSPIYLSDECIQKRTCLEKGLVRLQGRTEERGSGSAFFSADGLVGIAVKTDLLIAAPRIKVVLDSCAAGKCERNGSPIDLTPWSRQYGETLQPSKSYVEAGFREDVAFVKAFLESLPPVLFDRTSESGCKTDERRTTTRLEITAGRLTLTSRDVMDRAHCPSLPALSGVEVKECSARLDSLNSAIQISGASGLRILCKDGNCFSCTDTYDAKLEGREGIQDRRAYDIEYVHFSLADHTYFFKEDLKPREDRVRRLDRCTRALARIISGGTDREFCLRNPPNCSEN